jgi:ankyrin repeat protein
MTTPSANGIHSATASAPSQTPAQRGSLKSREQLLVTTALAGATTSAAPTPRAKPLTPFQILALRGDVQGLSKALDSSKAELEVADEEGNTPILLVARSGVVEAFKLLATAGAKVDATNNSGHNALHIVALKGQSFLATYIATTYKHLDKPDLKGNSPVHLTVDADHREACQALVDAGCDASTVAAHKRTPLQLASEKGKAGVVAVLTTKKELLESVGLVGFTSFHLAAYHNRVPVCELLKAAGAKADAVDQAGRMPIHYAAREKRKEALQWFITNYPALVNKPDGKGKTPLTYATEAMWAEGVGLLKPLTTSTAPTVLQTPKPANALTKGGRSPTTPLSTGVSTSVQASAHKRPVMSAASAHGKPSPRTAAPLNELQKAIRKGEETPVRALATSKKALLEVRDAEGLTPLLWSVANKKLKLCTILLVHAKADATTPSKQNALHLAVKTGDEAYVNLFLKKGLSNGKDVENNTPLHFAFRCATVAICKSLLKDGASPIAVNKQGQTALHFAAQRKEPEFAELLATYPNLLTMNDSDGNPPLLEAARSSSVATCKALIAMHAQAKAPVTVTNLAEQSVFHMGAQNLEENILPLFMENSQLRDKADIASQTPLFIAVKSGNLNACKELEPHASFSVVCGGKSLLDIAQNPQVFSLIRDKVAMTSSATGGSRFQTPTAARPASSFSLVTPSTSFILSSAFTRGAATPSATTLLHTPLAVGHARTLSTPSLHEAGSLIAALGQPLDGFAVPPPLSMPVDSKADSGGLNPLQQAAKNGDDTTLARLIAEKKIPIDEADTAGFTPFLHACANGHLKACQALLEADAAVAKKRVPGGKTGLHLAAMGGHEAVVRLLASDKELLDAVDDNGSTALILGARYNKSNVCQALIDSNANPLSTVVPSQRNCIHIAAQLGHKKVVEVLVKVKGLVASEDGEGQTPLHRAAFAGEVDVCKMLVLSEASPRAVDKKGRTPLHTAASVGEVAVVSELALNPNLRDAQDHEGNTPLMLGAKGGHHKVVEVLVANYASPTVTNKEGHTALHIAVLNERAGVVSQLSSFRNLVDLRDKLENTPLILAAGGTSAQICATLIRNNADKRATNASGDTALAVAKLRGVEAVIKVLKS